MDNDKWMSLGRYAAGFVTAIILVTMVNCSGSMPVVNEGGGMTIIDHSAGKVITTHTGEDPCAKSETH